MKKATLNILALHIYYFIIGFILGHLALSITFHYIRQTNAMDQSRVSDDAQVFANLRQELFGGVFVFVFHFSYEYLICLENNTHDSIQ